MAETVMEKSPHRVVQKAKEIVEHQKHRAEHISSAIEDKAAPIYVGLTLGSIILSLVLFMRRSRENATYVGLWAPTFLALGLFHRLERMRKE
jgi:hypothetical protein